MKAILFVIKKELKNLFKHSSTLVMSIILPLIYLPILLTVFIKFSNNTSNSLKSPNIGFFVNENSLVNVTDSNNENLKKFKIMIGDTFSESKYIESDDYENDLIELKIDIFVSFKTNIQNGTQKYDIEMIYSSNNELGLSYVSLISQSINNYSMNQVDVRLSYLNTSLNDLTPVNLSQQEMKDKFKDKKYQGFNDSILCQILPTFLTLFLSFGSFAVTNQLFIMEKEKNTLEPLLTTACKRSNILTGKIITASIFSLISFMIEFIGLLLAILINLDYFQKSKIFFLPTSVLMIIISLLSVTFLTTIISITSVIYSKNLKNANAKQSLLQFIPSVLSIALMFLRLRTLNSKAYSFIPIFGSFTAFKLASYGIVNVSYFVISICINIALSAILLQLSYQRYDSEKIL